MKKAYLYSISIIAALVITAGSFYGGMLYKDTQTSTRGFDSQGPGGGLRGGIPPQGTLGQGQNSSNHGDFTAGEIIEKDSESITVKTRDGSSKIVYFSKTTSVGKTVEGSISDLKKAQQVTVIGKEGSEGSISASNIQIRPLN